MLPTTPMTPPKSIAYENGFKSGQSCLPQSENPYPKSSADYKDWLDGWLEGFFKGED